MSRRGREGLLLRIRLFVFGGVKNFINGYNYAKLSFTFFGGKFFVFR